MARRSRPSGSQTSTWDAPGNASGVLMLARQLGSIPTELRKTLRPALRQVGEKTKADVAARASWSTRIPRSLRVRPVLTGKSVGVYVEAQARIAPHARAYEGLLDRRDSFRHPVFGDRDAWVSQATRPFMAPGVAANARATSEAISDAVDEAARAAGFR